MNEEKKQLDAKLLEVARYLPGEWILNHKYDESHWMAELIDGEGHGIDAFTGQTKGRLEIDGSWPKSRAGEVFAPFASHKITVSLDRESAVMATDIARRFLPDYLKMYAEQAKRASDADGCRDKQKKLANELAALMERGREERNGRFVIELPGWRNEIEVTVGSEVNITLHYLDAKKAKAVLRAVKRILSK